MYDHRGYGVCGGEEWVHHPPASTAGGAALQSKTCLTVHVSVKVGFAPGKNTNIEPVNCKKHRAVFLWVQVAMLQPTNPPGWQ